MIGVLGSGSWATAIVKILLENKEETINWWVRESEIRESLNNEGYNALYLTEAELDVSRLVISEDINQVVENSDDVFIVIPSAYVAGALGGLSLKTIRKRNWISATKGLVSIKNQTVTQYLKSHFGVDPQRIAVVSGPSHAEEVAQKKLCYLTIASLNQELAHNVESMIHCGFVNTCLSTDVEGIEYATALKNVYAVAMGMVKGAGLGDNLIAVLVSSAVREMSLFLNQNAPSTDRCMDDFVYLGDLLVTCYSQYSRNRTFGQMVGHGYSIASAQHEMNMVAEGYYAAECLERLREQSDLDMPILQAVYGILYRKVPPRVMLRSISRIK